MLHKLKITGLLMILLAVTGTAYAITPVDGVITENTVWTAAGGPYTVVGSIKVAQGVTLTIEGGAVVQGAEVKFLSNLMKSHQTHFDTSGKGPGITDCNVCHNGKFKDGLPIETTTVCNDCHSPNGSFPGASGLMDPVIGAKVNFALGGVYEDDGVNLKAGKEKWCSTCHDEQQSISNPVGLPATYAPNVVGDNSTYGYWATGHGKSINNCLECHDANKKHFDHEHRTYEIDETTGDVVNPWGNSYRLRTAATKASDQLCIKCHDRFALINEGGQSNFKSVDNGHNPHVWGDHNKVAIGSDTDYDGVADSRSSCVTCHNVHGSKSNVMTRTGELASTPGTEDRTPGLNQTYAKPAPGPFSTATWVPDLPSAGTYGVYAWWRTNGNLDNAAKYIINHDGGQSTVTVQQRNNGSQWVSLGEYSFAAGSSGSVVLTAENALGAPLIADQMGFDTNGDAIPDIIVDDADPGFNSIDLVNGGEWPWSAFANGRALANMERFTLDVSLAESTAGWARFNPDGGNNHGIPSNNVCFNCHSSIVYERTPFLGPKVINRFEKKRWVLNDGTGVADIVVSVTDPDGNMAGGSVTIDASSLGGGSSVAMTDNGDRTFSYQIAIAQGTFDKAYNLPITATDAAGNVGTGATSVYVKSSADSIYLDNVDAILTHQDGWSWNPTDAKAYDGRYVDTYDSPTSVPDEDMQASWKTKITKAGSYNIYVWLYHNGNRNQNASYTVEHQGGTTLVPINQEGTAAIANGDWVLLGTFNYEEGATASITVGATGLSIGERLYIDAVKLELAP